MEIRAALEHDSSATHRRGRKPGRPTAIATTAEATPTKRRKRRSFSVTAPDLILSFVKQKKKNPTSKEINAHWKSENRSGTADNTLSLMVKTRILKRTPLGEGIRGSRYSLA